MALINIMELCGAARVTRADGAVLRRTIEEHWNDSEPVALDFDGVRIASVSFFDESLGMLAREHPLDELRSRVRMQNMDPADRRLLNDIVTSRSRERRLSEGPEAAPTSTDERRSPT